MEFEVILLLIVAAAMHATWNFLSKRSLDKQAFLWLSLAIIPAVSWPILFLYTPISPVGWGLILLSGLLEAAYFILLGSAYERGDLSLVYPLARGSAPLFVTLFAYIFLAERPSAGGIAGIVLIVAGIYTLHLKSSDREGLCGPFLSFRGRASQLALLTGLMIAGYSVVDKAGVSHVHPVLYLYFVFVVAAVLVTPYIALTRAEAVRLEWQVNRPTILAVAALSVGTYLLVLFALTTSKVSYVSPVREVSVLFGALLGTLVLKEPFARMKLVGSLLIFAGIVCIGLAR